MNIAVELKDDHMFITGGKVKSARVNSHEDHRIAMAEAVAALGATGEIYIKDAHCVAKSYPGFFDDLRKIGTNVS
jgi:3-phosphoshikimate 1-carboxyvinyltransferase